MDFIPIEWIIFLLGQSLIIVGAVAVSYIRTQIAIAKLQMQGNGLVQSLTELKGDHRTLSGKVDGISRGLARIQGEHHISEVN